MKTILTLLFMALLFVSCKDQSPQPQPAPAAVTAYVHYGTYGVPGIQIKVLQTGKTAYTDSTGTAKFSLPAGTYTLRA
jgi:hypothetical protein